MKECRYRDVMRRERGFIILLAAFALVNVLRYFEHIITEYNTTLFAMSYKYGFISRGFLGTIWAGLDRILSIDLMTYEAVYGFACISTIVFFVILFGFYLKLLKMSDEGNLKNMRYLIVFLSIFTFSMFLTDEVFGRLDLWLYILTFVAIILLIEDKAIWMMVPIVGVCMCIHQGYVLTCANIVIALLIYIALMSEGKKSKRYIEVLVVTIIVMAVLFIYFEFFSHGAGEAIADEVISAAKAISPDGKSYNESIINHEILGRDVYESEMEYHLINWQEAPTFLLLFFPYLIIAFKFFKNVLKAEGDKRAKLARLVFVLGGLAVVPQMLLKVDFGRYVYMTFSYYIIMVMCMIAMGDETISGVLENAKASIKSKTPFPLIVLIYPMFFIPLHDVVISGISWRVSTWISFWMEWIK
ncbi:MAG: hypothetical protein K6B67_04645 [Lachnospiraceae bacterium]|nr:hypothetical protein [Lachnospiraceae bacterium]